MSSLPKVCATDCCNANKALNSEFAWGRVANVLGWKKKKQLVNWLTCVRLISKNEDWPDFSYTLHKDNQSDSTVSVGTVESRNVRNVERRICKVLGVLSIQHLTLINYCFGKVTKMRTLFCLKYIWGLKYKLLSPFSLKHATPHLFNYDNQALFLLLYPSWNIPLSLWALSLPAKPGALNSHQTRLDILK